MAWRSESSLELSALCILDVNDSSDLDLLTCEGCAAHHHLMGCICAKYEASNRHEAMERTRPVTDEHTIDKGDYRAACRS